MALPWLRRAVPLTAGTTTSTADVLFMSSNQEQALHVPDAEVVPPTKRARKSRRYRANVRARKASTA